VYCWFSEFLEGPLTSRGIWRDSTIDRYPQIRKKEGEVVARTKDKLTAVAVRTASFKDRARKLFDGGGLYLHLQASGKYWRLKYRWGGKEKLLALGVYPDVSLH
jgi:hypothetical protein